MSEEKKEKKIRLYKFGSEYNLSTESLVEFLQKKGYEVKGHMSVLTDEMIADIKVFFKKDIEKAEIHYKKISEFQKKRGDQEPEPEVKPEAPKVEVAPVEEVPATEAAPVETPEVQPELTEEISEEVSTTEESVSEVPEPVQEGVEESAPAEVVEKVVQKPYKTQTEIRLESQKKGLTIVGKMDLDKKPRRSEPAVDDSKKDLTKPPKTEVVEESEEDKKKKKKKRKLG